MLSDRQGPKQSANNPNGTGKIQIEPRKITKENKSKTWGKCKEKTETKASKAKTAYGFKYTRRVEIIGHIRVEQIIESRWNKGGKQSRGRMEASN